MIFSKIKSFIAYLKRLEYNANRLIFEQRKIQLENFILQSTERGISDYKYCDEQIIVSLTTYGKRIYDVYLSIASIMLQTYKPNRIVLWLDYSFSDFVLPKYLLLLKEKGLEIRFCEDLRSYKKLIPSLKEFPNDAIVTIEDDIIYDADSLEKLITAYQKAPQFIHSSRHHIMKLNNGKLQPYNNWEWVSKSTDPDVLNFPTGGAGTLYPPHSLDDEVFNKDIFMKICPTADDVWFKAMALKKGTLSQKIVTHTPTSEDYIYNLYVQDSALMQENVYNNGNDIQIQKVFCKYNLLEKLK